MNKKTYYFVEDNRGCENIHELLLTEEEACSITTAIAGNQLADTFWFHDGVIDGSAYVGEIDSDALCCDLYNASMPIGVLHNAGIADYGYTVAS